MTETIDSTAEGEASASAAGNAPKKRGGGLNSMLIADLKSMASGMGIAGAGSMKKAQLVEAIKSAQNKSGPNKSDQDKGGQSDGSKGGARDAQATDRGQDDKNKDHQDSNRQDRNRQQSDGSQQKGDQQKQGDQKQGGNRNQGQQNQQQNQGGRNQGQQQGQQGQQGGQQGGQQDDTRSSRSRRRRGRDRDRDRRPGGGGQQRNEPDTTILEDDVLLPAAGILDVLDNYAFVRTSGYLPGSEDVYVSLTMVRKYGLRRGDAIVGQVRQPREGERKEKFNPMVRIDSVNGADPEAARSRVDFGKLTPLYPTERLRLETEPTNLIGRVIDIAAPIGKGQRGLIVSPSKAGKTMIMQSIANSITTNNPECHLMVVLVDERPEEVTDFERSVKGEVVSSTFDRPASDHTTVSELAIERAKRLVELGHDVVVLLDG
ncbi:MAG: Rho termination factor N-terminal domain-containing protein, partial [Nocardioides sp.]